MTDPKRCKNGQSLCGTHWDCDACKSEARDRARRRLTPTQREYDRLALSGELGSTRSWWLSEGEQDAEYECGLHGEGEECGWCREPSRLLSEADHG